MVVWSSQNQQQQVCACANLPAVQEVLEDSGGPELVQLPDHTDPHVPVPSQQPGHVFAVTCEGGKNNKMMLGCYSVIPQQVVL